MRLLVCTCVCLLNVCVSGGEDVFMHVGELLETSEGSSGSQSQRP